MQVLIVPSHSFTSTDEEQARMDIVASQFSHSHPPLKSLTHTTHITPSFVPCVLHADCFFILAHPAERLHSR